MAGPNMRDAKMRLRGFQITGLYPLEYALFLPDDSGESITIRSCALDSGTLTTDTEIIRMSHCGGFYFQD
ncbi:hypothetical protein SK128_017145, partial [Halocaridina rubra]